MVVNRDFLSMRAVLDFNGLTALGRPQSEATFPTKTQTRRLTKLRCRKMLGGLIPGKYICAKSRDHIDVLFFSCLVRKYGRSRILDEFQAHVVGRLAILRLGTCRSDAIFLR